MIKSFHFIFQTVLENSTPAGDDDFELWDQNQMLRSEQQNVYK